MFGRRQRAARRNADHPVPPADLELAEATPGTDVDGDGTDDLVVTYEELEELSGLSEDSGDKLPPVRSALPPRPERNGAAEEDRATRPIVPEDWRDQVRDRAGVSARVAAYHLVRLVAGVYLGRCVRWTPRGLSRALVAAVRIATDYESKPARDITSQRGQAAELLALRRSRSEYVRWRGPFLFAAGVVLALVFLGALAASLSGPTLGARASALSVLVAFFVAFGLLGAPEDRPIAPKARTIVLGQLQLTNERIRAAFHAAELPKPPSPALLAKVRDGDISDTVIKRIAFVADPARVGPGRGTGVEFIIDLPPGLTAASAVKKRSQLASALGIGLGQLHITPDPDNAARIKVYVADSDPMSAPVPDTPLATAGSFNVWEAIPFGLDVRGFPVFIKMIWSNLLVGAIPRMGKSFALLLIACAFALDWRTDLIVLNGKKGIWRIFERIAYRYVAGARDDAVAYVLRVLQELKAEVERRGDLIEELAIADNPEGKLTPAIAADPGNGCRPTLVLIDEAQRFMGHPKYGAQITALLEEIVEVAPYVGIMFALAIQRPTHQTISTRLRGNIGIRFCLKMMDQDGAKATLGRIVDGLNPVHLLRRHKGVGVLDGSESDEDALGDEADETKIVRTYRINLVVAEQIIERAYDLRQRSGRITGYAAGDDLPEESTPWLLLDHLCDAIAPGEDQAWSETLIERIEKSHPGEYDGWTPDDLARALRHYEVETRQIKRRLRATSPEGEEVTRDINRRGVRVADLWAAYEREMARRETVGATAGEAATG